MSSLVLTIQLLGYLILTHPQMLGEQLPVKKSSQPGYDIHSLPWDFDGPNRNRWFTYWRFWEMLGVQFVPCFFFSEYTWYIMELYSHII